MGRRKELCFTALILCAFRTSSSDSKCEYNELSKPVESLLCLVENGGIFLNPLFPEDDKAYCLLGFQKCNSVRPIPKEQDTVKVVDKPVADNKDYQKLSLIAEKEVPVTWWRESFRAPQLLLTPTAYHLPLQLLKMNKESKNKRLKNIVNCLCRQTVVRVGFSNDTTDSLLRLHPTPTGKKPVQECTASEDETVRLFFSRWKADDGAFGGKVSAEGLWTVDLQHPATAELYSSARSVLTYFIKTSGGIWTGCIGVARSSYCRGALSSAAMLVAIQTLFTIASTSNPPLETLASQLTEGYFLASIGRHLLHGSSLDSHERLTEWRVALSDFTALQSIFLRLYMNSFGKQYTKQLNRYIPLAFPPSFQVGSSTPWSSYAHSIEPVYSSLRNWMFTEARNLIDFGPYHPLVAIPEAREEIGKTSKRRVLIDVGANGFLASPKYLIDSYAIYLPFTDIIMIEPAPHFSASVPPSYSTRYKIQFLQIYAEVGTRSKTDLMKLLPTLAKKEDYVVLKFDVDPNRFAKGPTMEWGFLFALCKSKEVLALVDEIYIELHFFYPDLEWDHYHSNWEGLDVFRYLRNNGVIVHCWP